MTLLRRRAALVPATTNALNAAHRAANSRETTTPSRRGGPSSVRSFFSFQDGDSTKPRWLSQDPRRNDQAITEKHSAGVSFVVAVFYHDACVS